MTGLKGNSIIKGVYELAIFTKTEPTRNHCNEEQAPCHGLLPLCKKAPAQEVQEEFKGLNISASSRCVTDDPVQAGLHKTRFGYIEKPRINVKNFTRRRQLSVPPFP
jgi:hypothetical protein